jgi:hypothetical protein
MKAKASWFVLASSVVFLAHCTTSFVPSEAEAIRDASAEIPDAEGNASTDAGTAETSTAVCGSADILPATCKCAPAKTSGAFKLPIHTSYGRLGFPNATQALSKIEMKIRIVQDPGDKVGMYVAPFNGTIDGTLCYLGFQTNVTNNALGTATGKGLVFSRWNTLAPEDTRVAAGGFIEVGTHEGEFVGVRLNYPWRQGDYSLTLERKEADGPRDWFELAITDAAAKTTVIGALRFPRSAATVPASIATDVTAFTEVYAGATDFGKVPAWELEIATLADSKPAKTIALEYPAYPNNEKYPNTDGYYVKSQGAMHYTFGGLTEQCHAAGKLVK